MGDWQPGDLALCVKGGEVTRAGRCYIVSDVKTPGEIRGGYLNATGETLLRFIEAPPPRPSVWAASSRFRKITPDKADEFDREVIDLMLGGKVEA